jgi:hypothetical protein
MKNTLKSERPARRITPERPNKTTQRRRVRGETRRTAALAFLVRPNTAGVAASVTLRWARQRDLNGNSFQRCRKSGNQPQHLRSFVDHLRHHPPGRGHFADLGQRNRHRNVRRALVRVANPFLFMDIFHFFYVLVIILALIAGIFSLLAGFALLAGRPSTVSTSPTLLALPSRISVPAASLGYLPLDPSTKTRLSAPRRTSGNMFPCCAPQSRNTQNYLPQTRESPPRARANLRDKRNSDAPGVHETSYVQLACDRIRFLTLMSGVSPSAACCLGR